MNRSSAKVLIIILLLAAAQVCECAHSHKHSLRKASHTQSGDDSGAHEFVANEQDSTNDSQSGTASSTEPLSPNSSTSQSSTGENTTGENSTGDNNTTGDNSTGDNSTGDNSTGDNTTGDNNTTSDKTAGENNTGDNTTGDNSTGNNSTQEGSNTPPPSKHGESGLLIVLIIIIVIAVVWVALRIYRKHIITHDLSMRPELLIQRQQLTKKEESDLDRIKFNVSGKVDAPATGQQDGNQIPVDGYNQPEANDFPPQNPNVTVTDYMDEFGQMISIDFNAKNKDQQINSISTNWNLGNFQKEIAYFEIEIEKLDKDAEINIGYCHEQGFDISKKLIDMQDSVQFSSSGELHFQKRLVYNFAEADVSDKQYDSKISIYNTHEQQQQQQGQKNNTDQFVGFGETLGIAIEKWTGNVFVSKNGQILNEPPPVQQDNKVRSKTADGNTDDNAKQDKNTKQRLKEEEQLKKQLTIKPNQEQLQVYKLHPVLQAKGNVKVLLNIGKKAFRLYESKVSKGLV